MTRAAIFIDGGFLLSRLGAVQPSVDRRDVEAVGKVIDRLVESHLKTLHRHYEAKSHWQLLYRVFYYDARPFSQKALLPVSRRPIDFAKSDQAKFREALFERLRRTPNVAVRLGETLSERGWAPKPDALKALLAGRRQWADLTDDDFDPGIRQKAVDMRFGLDIASVALKRQAEIMILVTGDSDFVPAAKLARREGVKVILDPLWQSVRPDLFEHIDQLRSGLDRPKSAEAQP
jgi:uncharacterized LabA/DUF88 family protein